MTPRPPAPPYPSGPVRHRRSRPLRRLPPAPLNRVERCLMAILSATCKSARRSSVLIDFNRAAHGVAGAAGGRCDVASNSPHPVADGVGGCLLFRQSHSGLTLAQHGLLLPRLRSRGQRVRPLPRRAQSPLRRRHPPVLRRRRPLLQHGGRRGALGRHASREARERDRFSGGGNSLAAKENTATLRTVQHPTRHSRVQQSR